MQNLCVALTSVKKVLLQRAKNRPAETVDFRVKGCFPVSFILLMAWWKAVHIDETIRGHRPIKLSVRKIFDMRIAIRYKGVRDSGRVLIRK